MAAQLGHVHAVRALLDLSAAVDDYDNHGWTALHLSAVGGHCDVTRALIEDAHAVVNCQNQYGRTPLHCACAAGHVGVIIILLRHHADVTINDQQDRSALDHVAVLSGEVRKEIQTLLIDCWPSGVPQYRSVITGRPSSIGQYVNIDSHAMQLLRTPSQPIIQNNFWH